MHAASTRPQILAWPLLARPALGCRHARVAPCTCGAVRLPVACACQRLTVPLGLVYAGRAAVSAWREEWGVGSAHRSRRRQSEHERAPSLQARRCNPQRRCGGLPSSPPPCTGRPISHPRCSSFFVSPKSKFQKQREPFASRQRDKDNRRPLLLPGGEESWLHTPTRPDLRGVRRPTTTTTHQPWARQRGRVGG